jgi:hypothetical protein
MEQSVFVLLLGVVLGCVVASGIWAVLWALVKGDKRLQKDRIDIMRNIAVLCAEIDGILAGRAGSSAAFLEFQSSLSVLLEKIQRNLTISMPLLDVYYVKYIESLIARYQQATTRFSGGEKPATITPMTAKAADFEVTQQFDFVKEKPVLESLDKKPYTVKMPVEPAPQAKAVEMKKAIVLEAEKPHAEFSDEIAFEFKRTSPDELKSALKGSPKSAADKKPMEDTGIVDIEEMIKTQKIDMKEENTQTVKQQQEEHFISGEDVIDKLDSFFGFDNK